MSDGLPPHQLPTRRFPIIGERDPEPFDPATWTLELDGLVATPRAFAFDALTALPRTVWDVDVHCVTRWTRAATRFAGIALADALALAAPTPDTRFVRFASGRGHDTTLPLARALRDTLLATHVDLGDGLEPLPPGHGGPLRGVTRERYFYKSVKWLRRVECLAEDRLGFWERTAGYHNGADPWTEQRYVVRGADGPAQRRMIAARDFAGQDLLGADLRGLDLEGASFAGAQLRAADLSGAVLRGADLSGANFTNARLTSADLRRARLGGADLEGADLRDSDLRDAVGAPLSLTAAEFVAADGTRGARVDGLDWSATPRTGLVESQEAYLSSRGVRLAD